MTLAFGSCGHQDTDLPILFEVAKLKPNYFIFLGDNIYGDSKRKSVIKKKYEQLGAIPSFQLLKTNTSVLATWDDHDFGKNDAGKEFTKKKQNKKIFLDFFKEPLTSDRWVHDGIYTSYNIELEGAKVQVILLDTRTFRDQLVRTKRKNRGTSKHSKLKMQSCKIKSDSLSRAEAQPQRQPKNQNSSATVAATRSS